MQKLDLKTIGLINTFEKITSTHVKNMFLDKQNGVIFVVNEGEAGKAIGRFGSKIKKLSYLMKRRVKVVEFDPDSKEFVKNCIAPLKVESVEKEGENIIIHEKDRQIRAQIIGRNKENLKMINEIVKEYFGGEVSVDQ